MTKLFLESEFQQKGIKQTEKKKKKQILFKILWFSWQQQIQKIKSCKYYTGKDKNIGQTYHH